MKPRRQNGGPEGQNEGPEAQNAPQKAKMKPQKAKLEAQKAKMEAPEGQKDKMKPQKAKLEAHKPKMEAPEGQNGSPRRPKWKPQKAKMKPQEAKMKAQKAKTKPQKAKMKPEKAKMKPQKAKMKPQKDKALQDHRRGTTLWRTTAEGLRYVVLGYCHSIGRSRVSLCRGLQGVAPRVLWHFDQAPRSAGALSPTTSNTPGLRYLGYHPYGAYSSSRKPLGCEPPLIWVGYGLSRPGREFRV